MTQHSTIIQDNKQYNRPMPVSSGIILKGDKILISQRNKNARFAANKWEFPGGKVEHLEDPKDCLIREIKEELNINIEIESLFTVSSYVYNEEKGKAHAILIVYIAKYVSGTAKNLDCQDHKWITVDELSEYDFANADISVVKEYIDYRNNIKK